MSKTQIIPKIASTKARQFSRIAKASLFDISFLEFMPENKLAANGGLT
jgi:hypothetical protein